MTPTQHLHYAIGEIAYAVAKSDGEVQPAERKKLKSIIEAELRCKDFDYEITDIIFEVLEKEKASTQDTYDWAIKRIRVNSHYLSPHLKESFIKVMEKIAKAFPPVTIDEMVLIEKFKKDIETINGDPVYYNQS